MGGAHNLVGVERDAALQEQRFATASSLGWGRALWGRRQLANGPPCYAAAYASWQRQLHCWQRSTSFLDLGNPVSVLREAARLQCPTTAAPCRCHHARRRAAHRAALRTPSAVHGAYAWAPRCRLLWATRPVALLPLLAAASTDRPMPRPLPPSGHLGK